MLPTCAGVIVRHPPARAPALTADLALRAHHAPRAHAPRPLSACRAGQARDSTTGNHQNRHIDHHLAMFQLPSDTIVGMSLVHYLKDNKIKRVARFYYSEVNRPYQMFQFLMVIIKPTFEINENFQVEIKFPVQKMWVKSIKYMY